MLLDCVLLLSPFGLGSGFACFVIRRRQVIHGSGMPTTLDITPRHTVWSARQKRGTVHIYIYIYLYILASHTCILVSTYTNKNNTTHYITLYYITFQPDTKQSGTPTDMNCILLPCTWHCLALHSMCNGTFHCITSNTLLHKLHRVHNQLT